jgi:hypothetical protein
MLLARSVIIVDRQGIVRYIQITPEETGLPDMDAAFVRATELANVPWGLRVKKGDADPAGNPSEDLSEHLLPAIF